MRRTGGIAIEAALWALAAGAIGMTVVAARWQPRALSASAPMAGPARLATPPDVPALGRWSERVLARDPFRLVRHASPVPFKAAMPESGPGMPMVAMRPPKPVLVLRGLVGGGKGEPWQAVLDGVPGRERGVVARAGDVLGELHVRRVGADGVVITGMDTTWRMQVGDAGAPARRGP